MDPTRMCTLCNELSLGKLPYEEEDGLPHHTSLAALEKSAGACAVCREILWAAGCTLSDVVGATSIQIPLASGKFVTDLGGMVTSHQISLAPGKYTTAKAVDSLYNAGGWRMHESGASLLNKTGPEVDFRPPIHQNPRERFPKGTVGGVFGLGKGKPLRPWLYGNWWESHVPDMPRQLIGLGVRLGTSPAIQDAVGCSKKDVRLQGTYLRFRTDFDDSFVPGRIRAADSGSLYAFSRLKNWLEVCEKTHECVPTDTPKPLPTRVLDVAASQNMVLLRDTNGAHGKYIALSHCWGKSHRLTTTTRNISAHKNGIPLADLPATFRHAVQVARQLKIAYIWIDSLCILQDDATDWEVESAKMGSVYADSYLTVAALSSTDDSSGCFPDPETRFDKPFVSSDVRSMGRRCFDFAAPALKVQSQNGQTPPTTEWRCPYLTLPIEEKGNLFITREWMPTSTKREPKTYFIGEFGAPFDPIADEPLSERGWTFQERLLAPRTIHYGRTEMYWECQQCVLAEDGSFLPRKFGSAKKYLVPRPPPGKNRHDPWIHLVEDYTSRKLTMEQDKLPALSGLANMIAAETGDEYFAGLWKSSFLVGLTWYIYSYEPQRTFHTFKRQAALPPPVKSPVNYPAKYRAPSWSWASVDAQIECRQSRDKEVVLASVVDIQVTPDGKDPFGKVKSAWVKLKAPLYTLSHRVLKKGEQNIWRYRTPVNATGTTVVKQGSARFDLDPSFPCVALFLDTEHALILREGQGGQYSRIGLANFSSYEPTQERSPTSGQHETLNIANGEVREVVII